jgi:glucans biosynthesis protein
VPDGAVASRSSSAATAWPGPQRRICGPSLTTSTGTILGLKLWPYPDRKNLRVGFELDPGNENACELRLVLEAAGKPLSETWLYRWTP